MQMGAGSASPIASRGGLFESGISFKIHQFRRSRLFATSSAPVPGTAARGTRAAWCGARTSSLWD